MEVEQRMNLSLDDIIKQKSKGPKNSDKPARKPKLGGKQAARKGNGAVKARADRAAKVGGRATTKVLTVQRPKIQKNQGVKNPQKPAKGAKGLVKRGIVVKSHQKRRVAVAGRGKVAVAKRTVSVPQVQRNLTVTITNEKAVYQQQRQPQQTMPQVAFGYQSRQWGAQPQRQSYEQQPASQATYGFGPRNLQPREDASAAARFTLARIRNPTNQGVARRGTGVVNGAQRRQIPFIDYDNSRTGLRMDYQR